MPWEKAYSPLISWRKINLKLSILSVSPVAHSCLTICSPMNCNTLGFPVHHQLPELTQTHINRVGDAMQPSHPLLSPFSSHLQSFPASRSFLLSQFFPSGGQTIGVSASASVLPVNIQDWFPWGWTGWISLQSKGISRVFSNTTVQKHQFFSAQLSLEPKTHIHTWLMEKSELWLDGPLVGSVLSLLFNMLSRLVITFLPRSKRLLISWLQSPSAVIWECKN